MKKGFTLIELMIVVVIIGILSAVAIPNFVKVIDKAKIASVKSNMHTVQVTVETIAVDHAGGYCEEGDLDNTELPANFKNPYNTTEVTGDAVELIDADADETTTGTDGRVGFYSDASAADVFDGTTYTIMGFGKDGENVKLTLTPGSVAE
ncbi:MAG: type IV pilin protein [bacterium]